MVVLSVFRSILDEPLLQVLAIVLQAMATMGMYVLTNRMRPFQPLGQWIPDMQVTGYTANELNLFYDTLGEAGCPMYVQIANWDLFPFMIAYTVLLGTMLVWTARRNGWTESIAYAATLICVIDGVETVIQRQGGVIFPNKLTAAQIQVASSAVCLKWILVSISIAIIVSGNLLSRDSKKKKRQSILPY
jgi:hypothetical protein